MVLDQHPAEFQLWFALQELHHGWGSSFFLVTWLQSVPAPSGTGTPPEAVYGGLRAAHAWSTNKESGGAEIKIKKSHLYERIDVSGDKSLSVSKENRRCSLNREGTFQEVSIVHLNLWSWAGIPDAAEGIRAWKLQQASSYLQSTVQHWKGGSALFLVHFLNMPVGWACIKGCTTAKLNKNSNERESPSVTVFCFHSPAFEIHHYILAAARKGGERKEEEESSAPSCHWGSNLKPVKAQWAHSPRHSISQVK